MQMDYSQSNHLQTSLVGMKILASFSLLCGVFLQALVIDAASALDTDLFSSLFEDHRAEVEELTALPVEGTIPAYLKGGL